MTEAEWLLANHPRPMFDWLEGRASPRKCRLFACACCRRIWRLLTDERSRTAVERAEEYADGRATKSALAAACGASYWCWYRPSGEPTGAQREAAIAAYHAALPTERTGSKRPHSPLSLAALAWGNAIFEAERRTSSLSTDDACILGAALVREVFGNPFRPVQFCPGCLTPDVKALAAGVYEERAFDRLPILADALEDAGCSDAFVLDHCRNPGLHMRGCWLVDKILGKE
jgi:hypothetical protein